MRRRRDFTTEIYRGRYVNIVPLVDKYSKESKLMLQGRINDGKRFVKGDVMNREKRNCCLLFFMLILFSGIITDAQCLATMTVGEFSPSFPPEDICHSTNPDRLELTGSCYDYNSGQPIPIDWNFELFYQDCGSDCWFTGCHIDHYRIADGSQSMLTSMGGIKKPTESTWNSITNYIGLGIINLNIAKPEAAGTISLRVTCIIPPNLRSYYSGWPLWMNPGWEEGPDDWTIFMVLDLPYHVEGLISLPEGDNYLKSSNLYNHHTTGHQYYARPAMISRIQSLADTIRSQYKDLYGWNVKVSYNDLSLEYGGIFDVRGDWDCHENDTTQAGHLGHRRGRSVDLNVGSSSPQCLQCDSTQEIVGCTNKYSTDTITITNPDGSNETLTVKAWIDRIAQQNEFQLREKHRTGRRMHLEMD